MKKRMIPLFSILILLTACKNGQTNPETIKTVKLATVQTFGHNRTDTYPGRVKASSEINLAFRISGPITRIHVREDEQVRRGQVLAEMDARDYEIQLSATEAEYAQVKAEAERVMRLYEKESVSENDYDKAVAGLQQITAKYEAHKNALADTKLTAPFDGYVQKRFYNRDETVAAGMPVLSVISRESPEIITYIPATEYLKRADFETFTATFDIYPGVEFPLQLLSIAHKANLNQLYAVRFALKPGKDLPMPTPGLSATVNIGLKKGNGNFVSIPLSALFESGGKPGVWVYNETEGTVGLRQVTVEEIHTEGFVTLSAGLQPGEKIVAAGTNYLTEGQRVKPVSQAFTNQNGEGL